MNCHLCARPPTGIQGHEGLFLDENTARGALAVFRCCACMQAYRRIHQGGSAFAWVKAVEEAAQPPEAERG